MSAWICSDNHIKALALFAVSKSRYGDLAVDPRYIKGLEHCVNMSRKELAETYANTLLAENIRSVNHRYAENTPVHTIKIRDKDLLKRNRSVVVILKSCHCLNYQSCETSDWEDTVAYRLLQAIEKACGYALPGYDKAPWGI